MALLLNQDIKERNCQEYQFLQKDGNSTKKLVLQKKRCDWLELTRDIVIFLPIDIHPTVPDPNLRKCKSEHLKGCSVFVSIKEFVIFLFLDTFHIQ